MTLSYNSAYQEIILAHPTRRQIFAGKPYSTFPNIWEWLIYNLHPERYLNLVVAVHIFLDNEGGAAEHGLPGDAFL